MSAPRLAAVDEHGVPHALAWVRHYLAAVGSRSTGSGPISTRRMWQCPGPAHADGDARPSLSTWWQEDQGRVGVKCHSGCTWPDPLPALGLRGWDRRTPPSLPPAAYARQQGIVLAFPALDTSGRGGGGADSGFRFETFHAYGDRHRKERLRHPVTGKKRMSWETRDDSGAWVPGLRGARESPPARFRNACAPSGRRATSGAVPVVQPARGARWPHDDLERARLVRAPARSDGAGWLDDVDGPGRVPALARRWLVVDGGGRACCGPSSDR
ncbi:MAG: hypothetical protein ACRDRH_05635 [Pseudonocardia sp.]